MLYFKRIRAHIPTAPFLDEIASLENAWDIATGRQDKLPVQREAKAIPIRGLRKSAIGDKKRRDVHPSRWTTSARKFPVFCAFLNEIADDLDSELSRAKIVCLPAGRRVYPHIDRGEYYVPRNRYHLVLRSAMGSWLKAAE